MRVAILSHNAQAHDAIGNQVAEKLAFFRERAVEVRVFVESREQLHPEVRPCCHMLEAHSPSEGPHWDYLSSADLVIVEFGHYYRLLDLLPLLAGGRPRIVLDYHGVTPPELWGGHNREGLEKGRAYRGLAWCADAALAHSRFTCEDLSESTGYPSHRIHQLALPIEDVFVPGPPQWDVREELGLRDARIVLYVGRMAPNKGLPVLVNAVHVLRDQKPPVHAVVVGKTQDLYQTELRVCLERASELGVADRLHFLGPLSGERLRDAYATADVLVLPSRWEGFGVPVIESMACGLPVIAARTSALPETVGDAGLTFTADDPVDLARQVTRVLGPEPEALTRDPAARQVTRVLGPEPEALARDGAARQVTRVLGPEPKALARDGAARQVTRVLGPEPEALARDEAALAGAAGSDRPRVAIVCFRFGSDFAGGAETSQRTIAETLRDAGHPVEVFTTCTASESDWHNELPEGTTTSAGLTVHRFRIDPHDRAKHLESVRAIEESGGPVAEEIEQEYLHHALHSTALVQALAQQLHEFAAVIVGPYLSGLTHDVARAAGTKTLLLPCFHDEPFLRLRAWLRAYEAVGGILYHSPEEQDLAITGIGLNHPRSYVLGTHVNADAPGDPARGRRLAGADRYIVYCGRYSAHKRLPELLECLRRYHAAHPDRFRLVLMGQGEVAIPREDWARDLGFVSAQDKRDVLAGAAALVQLSRFESLSLVALEAWAQGTPVLADMQCNVMAGQVKRAQGGQAIADYAEFSAALDSLWIEPKHWLELGRNGQAYVRASYGSPSAFRDRLELALSDLHVPLKEQMRRCGLQRATLFRRSRWREKFGQLVERWLDTEPRPYRFAVEVRPHASTAAASADARRLLLPVRVSNNGTHAVLAHGPGRTQLRCRVEHADGTVVLGEYAELPKLLTPGQTQPASIVVPVPAAPDRYSLFLWAEQPGRPQTAAHEATEMELRVVAAGAVGDRPACAVLLDAAQAALADAYQRQRLPDDYTDVTEGWLADWKKRIKRKLLGNFKQAYVDVLSRQQSQVNRQLIVAVQQLAECCATLDHALRNLQQRLDRLEENWPSAHGVDVTPPVQLTAQASQ